MTPHEVMQRPPRVPSPCYAGKQALFRSGESRENSKLKVILTPNTARPPPIQYPIRTVIHVLLVLCYLLCLSIAPTSSPPFSEALAAPAALVEGSRGPNQILGSSDGILS